MNRYIVIYDKTGRELGRHMAVYNRPTKEGDQFLNEAVYYFYQLDTVDRIEVIYCYGDNPE